MLKPLCCKVLNAEQMCILYKGPEMFTVLLAAEST